MKKIRFFLLFALPILRGVNPVAAQTCDSIPFTLNYTDCDTFPTQLTITYPTSGGITYTFSVDGVASATNSWPRIVKGYHTISYVGSNGCTSRNYTRLVAANVPRYTYDYRSVCDQAATFTLRPSDTASAAFTFTLNEVPSATNTWQNVMPNRYRLGYTSRNQCRGVEFVYLYSSTLSFYLEQQPRTCVDTLYAFKFKVENGQPPYTFKIDGNPPTTDSIVFISEGSHLISVTDALRCQTTVSRIVYYQRDTVSATSSFTPITRCGDSIGMLKISITDTRITRPFTISLQGGPFTTDTVFPNIINQSGFLPFRVKSAQGCLYYGYTDSYTPTRILLSIKDSVCANRLGKGIMVAYAVGSNGAPINIRWNNGSTSKVLMDAPIGTYSITITDANGCMVTASKTLTTCVWPGDTDTSGVVNAADLLNIGLAFGERGESRPNCAIDTSNLTYCQGWTPFNVPFWSKQTATGVNLKHVDASGNGLINHNDTLAITRNWSRTRSLRGNTGGGLEVRGAAPPIYVQTGAVTEGRWTAFPIMFGNATNTATGVYGLYFTITYDPSVIDASSVYLSFGQNWMGSGDNVLRIFKNFDGAIEGAICRTNQQNANGSGQIATLNFKTKAGTAGRRLPFDVSNQYAINRDAQSVPIVIEASTTTVLTATTEPDWARQIDVYPNPTTDKVMVEGLNLTIQSIEVLDISGKSISKTQVIGNNTPLSIQPLGTYFLKIQTEKGVLMRKVVRL